MADVNSLIGKVLDLLFGAAKREINYIRKCAENVQNLQDEANSLKVMQGRIQQKIDQAKNKGEDLPHGVQDWVEKAVAETSKVEEFLKEEDNANKTCCNLPLCMNLCTLSHYSKLATSKVPPLQRHKKDGETYENWVTIPARTLGFLDSYQSKKLDNITTQKLILGKIIESIKDERKQIIGIYGLGGVGKTTLAKEVAVAVKNLFAAVVLVTVSQTVDVEKIQKKVEVAANRILNGEKILIILDDVWRNLELDTLGIPCGTEHMNCRILLTSRSIDVCEAMDAQSNICVETLPKEEAWILFKQVAGEKVETDAELKSVAEDVVNECGGLPLIIQAVGIALKNKRLPIWEAALERLRNHNPKEINQEIREAFVRLELSYEYLESEEAKSCFLLCSMFPEDASIPLEKLTHYMVGQGKFERLRSIEDAKDRVKLAVETLKSSFMLLDGDDESKVKMHDVVRDVAILIASEGQNNFLVEAGINLKEWRIDKDALKKYTTISLMYNDIRKVPDHELDCPRLDTLLLQSNNQFPTIPDAFFLGMKKVKVLDMRCTYISSLPQSFASLKKLRMLNLGGNMDLKEISIVAELTDLNILILSRTSIEEIPRKFGQLANLRLLDLERCTHLSHIAPGVISELHMLEELHIEYKSRQEGSYNYLVELSNLKTLTCLHLWVCDVNLFPEDLHVETLKEFFIRITCPPGYNVEDLMEIEITKTEMESSRCQMFLSNQDLKIPVSRAIVELIKVTHVLTLTLIGDLNDIVPSLNNGVSNNLEIIELNHCNISCLVDAKEMGDFSKNLFMKLHGISVSRCNELQIIVSSNMPRVVQNIRTLQVLKCPSVTCIFDCEGLGGGKGDETLLSKLESLSLDHLPELEVIWNYPDHRISLCNLVIVFVNDVKLRRLFSASVAQSLVHLKDLELFNCDYLKEVIWVEEEEEEIVRSDIEEAVQTTSIVFRCLENITLYNIPILKSFCDVHHTVEYPSLVVVKITDCGSMERWGNRVHHTPKLERVQDDYKYYIRMKGPYDINDATRRLINCHYDDDDEDVQP